MSRPTDGLELKIRETARAFPYPPTPDVASAVMRRMTRATRRVAPLPRMGWAVAAVVLVVVGGLLAVPQVRAAIAEVLRIGAVRIFLVAPTSTPTSTAAPALGARPTPTLRPTPTPLSSVLDLAGETTLEDARARAGFEIRLPAYPSDLGPPDRVFLQSLDGNAVVLVWLDRDRPDRVRLSLHQIAPGSFTLFKFEPRVIQETRVNGRPAVWTEGPYLLETRDGDVATWRLVEGRVLIWAEAGITYRLETDAPTPSNSPPWTSLAARRARWTCCPRARGWSGCWREPPGWPRPR